MGGGHGYFRAPQTASFLVSGSQYIVCPTSLSPYNCVQIVDMNPTGSTTVFMGIETTCVPLNGALNETPSTNNYEWYPEPSGTIPNFTGTPASQSSRLVHFGNNTARWLRVNISGSSPGYYKIFFHGKA